MFFFVCSFSRKCNSFSRQVKNRSSPVLLSSGVLYIHTIIHFLLSSQRLSVSIAVHSKIFSLHKILMSCLTLKFISFLNKIQTPPLFLLSLTKTDPTLYPSNVLRMSTLCLFNQCSLKVAIFGFTESENKLILISLIELNSPCTFRLTIIVSLSDILFLCRPTIFSLFFVLFSLKNIPFCFVLFLDCPLTHLQVPVILYNYHYL